MSQERPRMNAYKGKGGSFEPYEKAYGLVKS